VTVHVISVGTSILAEALEKPKQKLPRGLALEVEGAHPAEMFKDDGVRDHDRDGASEWLASALAPEGNPARDPARVRRLAEVTTAIHPELWGDDFSAELETMARMEVPRPFPAADIAILVCSDTPRGLLSGVWNAFALTKGALGRVSYLADLADSTAARRTRQELLHAARGRVVIARVGGMDAAHDDGFRRAMQALGVLARDLFKYGQLGKAEPFWFHLSGGYKAAIPYLIGMAEAVRSVDAAHLVQLGGTGSMPGGGKPYPVEAFVLHDSAQPGDKPIRLPLRRLFPEAVQDELKDFDIKDLKRRKKGKPDYATLEGYAYEATGQAGNEACELTPFGAGLIAFFGVPDEVPG
jgi:hypothetical protein